MADDLAWKQRVVQEDRKLLAQVIEARRRLAESPLPTIHNSDGAASSVASSHRKPPLGTTTAAAYIPPKAIAAPVGTSVRCARSSQSSSGSSIAPSVRSSATTQLSHHGVSTINGSDISQLTIFSTRLEKLEQRLEEERKERRRVVDELTQIKQLLQQQIAQKK